MKKFFSLLFLLIFSSSVYTQQDAEGWTILDPSKAEKVIYVSSSSGNDSSGQVYSFPSSSIGDDPFQPSGTIQAFETVEQAISSIVDGEAVWVLLKRGDVFYSSISTRTGKSQDQPFLYSSYGNSSQPPLLKTGAESGVAHCCEALEHFWIVGLSFYAHTRDPDSPEYISDAGDRGIYLETIRGRKLNNILLEGNVVRYYKDNVIQSFNGTGIVTNINLRRNMFLDGYNSSDSQNESIGLFVQNVNGFLLEENIFDHNGWLIPSYGNSEGQDKSNGQATQFSHSTYFVDNQNVIFRNNSFNRPSSNGNKWVASSTGSTQNILIENNLYNDCEIGISMGTNYPEGSYRFKDITIRGNVMVGQGNSNLTKRDLSWGIDIDDWDTGSFTDNILASQNNLTRSGFGVSIAGETKDLTIGNNIFYDLKDRRGILVSDKGSYQNITISNNELTYFDDFKRFIRLEHPNFSQLNFLNNTYTNANSISRPFVILDQDYEFNEWSQQYSNENASVVLPEYPDATRDLDRYISEVLGLSGRAEYYTELRNQTKHNWRDAYTGDAIVYWIRNGFRVNAELDTAPPVPNNSNLPDIVADCIVETLQSPTANDNISGEIQGVANSSLPITESMTLIWYYTDAAGNTSSQQQEVVIADTEVPTLNVESLPNLNANCSAMVTEIPTATDNCSGTIQGVSNIDISVSIKESKTINWSFTDSAGNSIIQQQQIIISDAIVPIFDSQNLPELSGDCSVTITDIPTASDNCDGSIQGVSNVDINSEISESTTIIWSYTDNAGNSISQSQRVVINGNDNFVTDLQNLPDLLGDCSVTIIDVPTARRGCNTIILGVPDIDITATLTESTQITWSYTDANDTKITQQQLVLVEDETAPEPNIESLPDVQGECAIENINYPSAFDGCDGDLIGVPNIELPILDENVEEIIWTYTDSNNNSFSQSQKVSLSITEACSQVEVENSDFEIDTFQETCKGMADGIISVIALKPMSYTAKITNDKSYEEIISFDELLNVPSLSPGEYTICFTATGRDFELCQNLTVTPAEELLVNVQVNEKDKKVLLELSGSNQYKVILNEVTSFVSEEELTLVLKLGANELEVQTVDDCQESYFTTISISDVSTSSKKLSVYPNPISDGLLYISIKDLEFVPNQFNIATMSGKVVKSFDDFNESQDEVVIDVSELINGIYILQGVLADRVYSTRFIKI